jgi:hypothetical protein
MILALAAAIALGLRSVVRHALEVRRSAVVPLPAGACALAGCLATVQPWVRWWGRFSAWCVPQVRPQGELGDAKPIRGVVSYFATNWEGRLRFLTALGGELRKAGWLFAEDGGSAPWDYRVISPEGWSAEIVTAGTPTADGGSLVRMKIQLQRRFIAFAGYGFAALIFGLVTWPHFWGIGAIVPLVWLRFDPIGTDRYFRTRLRVHSVAAASAAELVELPERR